MGLTEAIKSINQSKKCLEATVSCCRGSVQSRRKGSNDVEEAGPGLRGDIKGVFPKSQSASGSLSAPALGSRQGKRTSQQRGTYSELRQSRRWPDGWVRLDLRLPAFPSAIRIHSHGLSPNTRSPYIPSDIGTTASNQSYMKPSK